MALATSACSRARWLALLSVLAAGCSLAFPADQTQCSTNADCLARGAAFAGSVCQANVCVGEVSPIHDAGHDATRDAGHDAARDVTVDAVVDADAHVAVEADAFVSTNDWSCLGHVQEPEAGPGTVELTVPYVELLSGNAISGIRVQACDRGDPSCEFPLTDAGFTNDAGVVTLTVPSGYNGYVLSLWDASLPSLAYIDPPIVTSMAVGAEEMISKTDIAMLAGAVGDVNDAAVMIDPTKGIIFIGAYDCAGVAAAGVSFSIAPAAPGSLQVYVIDGLPFLNMTETDSSGNGAFVNVPVESITITATLAATGQRIGSVRGFSEASHISFLSPVPTP